MKQTLQVQRILFGPRFESIPLANIEKSFGTGRKIFCLWHAKGTDEFLFSITRFFESERVFELEEEPAVAAMAQARMDSLMIGSDLIFVGRPDQRQETAKSKKKVESNDGSSSRKETLATVRVERLLSDSGPKPGETVRLRSGTIPLPPGETLSTLPTRRDERGPTKIITSSLGGPLLKSRACKRD